MAEARRGDVVYTPEWVAQDMIAHFAPAGRLLDPCRGEGVFYDLLCSLGNTDWCEVSEHRNFFTYTQHVDWVIGNPPYSLTRPWFRHSYLIADNLLYLVPLRNVFSGYGFIEEIFEYGGICAIRVYGTGGLLNFPMGNAVGAMHIQRGYRGDTNWTLHQERKSPAWQQELLAL
jgi:hypothetical protein